MSAKVSLTVVRGKLAGQVYTFDSRETCVIGRGLDCNPRLPDDEAHRTISRHHCLLDINPPDARIRDFGSLNGTFVNEQKIGQRPGEKQAGETASAEFPEYDLKDGDEIRLGDTVLRVGIEIPVFCADCSAEIPNEEKEACFVKEGVYVCHDCRASSNVVANTALHVTPGKECAECGRNVADEFEPGRNGEYLCSDCRNDPFRVVKDLLNKANSGEEALHGVKGYSIMRELGKGGMGAVYLARHDTTKGQVAMKIMLPQVAADERSKEMFLREMENAKVLNHPNVVRLLDSGYADGVFFFTMEFCDGGGLDRHLRLEGGKLTVDKALKLILPLLDGLEHIHTVELPAVKLSDGNIVSAKGLVHRDLKPANVFLMGNGANVIPKIADVGLGKAFDIAGLSGQTMTGVTAGTPLFMPRQQIINFKYAKPDVDVWAMAATFYFMLTGKTPRDFPRGKDPWQTVLQTKAVPIRQREPYIPEKLAAVIDSALTDQPEITFKSAAQLKKAIEEAVRE
ncbi:MAG: protein kinase [Nitrospinae bacterium]|nr:protein kinase [Nitrospinota bacterium]